MAGWYFVLAFLFAHCYAKEEYYAVCDAGSTGTRLYVFQLDVDQATAKSIFVKKTKPGLSSYAENPAEAVPPLLKLLIEGSQSIPEATRSTTSLSILGTAGVRLLSPEKQNSTWKAVKDGLLAAQTFPFLKMQLEGRTASGEEEGIWALYNANFLTKRMSDTLLSLGKDAPLGLMDLGGSSTQISIPSLTAEKGTPLGKGAFVHSYLGFGMTYIREQMRKAHETPGEQQADASCYMRGRIDDKFMGAGDASSCRDLIRDLVISQSNACKTSIEATKPCLGDLSAEPRAVQAIGGKVDFYAVAGMTYVVDFVRWWLEFNPTASGARSFLESYPRPSLTELAVAVDIMCSGEYKDVADRTADKQQAHSFTGFDNAPYRCFQANYILVLLQEMYGFSPDGRSITFLLDVDGEDLEWPLGALLHRRMTEGASRHEL